MEVEIRRPVPQDASAITRLTHQLGYEITEEQTLQNILAITSSEENDVFVAVFKAEVIGWIGVSYFMQIESPPFCEIRGLVVDGQYRGKGIGKFLIERAKQWGREKGIESLRLRCNVNRTASIMFYRRLGFREIKQQMVFEVDI